MIKLRRMTKLDVPYVCDIQMQSFGIRDADGFDKDINNPIYYYGVAEYGIVIVGYAMNSIHDDDIEITCVAVDEHYRYRGFAYEIVSQMIDIARTMKKSKIIFEAVDNPFVLELRDKFGFVLTKNGKDVVYSLKL